jgi:hypothetical protein
MRNKFFLPAVFALMILSFQSLQKTGVITDAFGQQPVREASKGEAAKMEKDSQTESEEISLNGNYLKAFNVAFEAFQKDKSIPESKKHLENYSVMFSKDKQNIFVFFYAERLENESGLKGGETSRGRSVTYRISSDSFKIRERILSK